MARTEPPAGPRLMLVFTVTPALDARTVEQAVRAGDVACVVLRVSGEGLDTAHLRAVAEAAQRHEAAVVLDGPEGLVAVAGLDGLHASAGAGLDAVVRRLKPATIVGAGALASRHDAMEAGESGVDYVAFGDLDPAAEDFPRTLDLVAWWTDLFEVPSVGVASSLDEAEALARAGADFVALAERLLEGPAAAKTVAAAQARITGTDGGR